MDLDTLTAVRPSARQYAWQSMEFYGFIHFGMNTVTDREWGEGHDDLSLFDPVDFDADQWVGAMKDAGMTGVIVTCKHHDGFCLWPSGQTDYSVASTPWRGGDGDVVAEVARAAERHGLKLGVYLSPWDRTDASYGTGTAYDDYYVAQLTELLTHYGPVFSVWLDGANGEGANGKVQHYDWDRYYATVRALQPDAVISVCGPDVRWCGNEAGHTRPDEWSVVPRELQDVERVADKSQKVDDGEFSRDLGSDEEDLGSREALADYTGELVWYPAEVNTSIRPGWFYHADEDARVRGAEELFEIYKRSVGGNSTFLLNVPPRPDGLLAEEDVAALRGLGALIRDMRARALTASVTASTTADGHDARSLSTLENDSGVWAPADGDAAPTVTLTLDAPATVVGLVLKEEIREGQRVERVVVSGRVDGHWMEIAESGCIGYQRILDIAPVTVDALRLTIARSRGTAVLAGIAVLGESAR